MSHTKTYTAIYVSPTTFKEIATILVAAGQQRIPNIDGEAGYLLNSVIMLQRSEDQATRAPFKSRDLSDASPEEMIAHVQAGLDSSPTDFNVASHDFARVW